MITNLHGFYDTFGKERITKFLVILIIIPGNTQIAGNRINVLG